MVVGSGLIATLFKNSDKEDVVFFASGVSNSLEVRKEEFMREELLLKKTIEEHPEKIFTYFSTCSIYDSSKSGSAYVSHKLKMEQIVANNCKNYLILRVSNAVGKGGNPNLLMNYLMSAAKSNTTINVHTKATRNLIDVEDIKNITLRLLEEKTINKIVNIAYIENYSIIEILQIIENTFNIRLDLNLMKSGQGYAISVSEIENYFEENGLTNKDDYLCKIIKKYYI